MFIYLKNSTPGWNLFKQIYTNRENNPRIGENKILGKNVPKNNIALFSIFCTNSIKLKLLRNWLCRSMIFQIITLIWPTFLFSSHEKLIKYVYYVTLEPVRTLLIYVNHSSRMSSGLSRARRSQWSQLKQC